MNSKKGGGLDAKIQKGYRMELIGKIGLRNASRKRIVVCSASSGSRSKQSSKIAWGCLGIEPSYIIGK